MELSSVDAFIKGKWELAEHYGELGERVSNIPAGDKLVTIKTHTHTRKEIHSLYAYSDKLLC